MPRSNWKGVISFGLVTIPIVLYPSQNKTATIHFHQIDKRDNARIKYQRINSETGKVVPWEDITRGYEYDKDMTIPVPEKILEKVAGDKSREINIEKFVNLKSIDLLTLENVYYLAPDKNGMKGYVILRDALAQTQKAGVAKVVISTKEYLSAIFVHENALVLCLLKYENEMKKPSDFDLPDKNNKKYKVTNKEREMAKKLILSMAGKWKPQEYKDDYQDAIHEWVEKTVNHLPQTVTKGKGAKRPRATINFIDILKKSLAASGKSPKKRKAITKKLKPGASKHKHANHRVMH